MSPVSRDEENPPTYTSADHTPVTRYRLGCQNSSIRFIIMEEVQLVEVAQERNGILHVSILMDSCVNPQCLEAFGPNL